MAVIDSGIYSQHPSLQANYRYGYDFAYEDSEPNDISGHGTFVSGIIGAKDKQIGVATEVGLIALKAGGPTFYDDDILQSLQWVLSNHRQYNIIAVNLSLGGGRYTSSEFPVSYYDKQYLSGIQKLESEGVTVVAAAGNSYYDGQYQNVFSPAIYSTLAVGAVWPKDAGQIFWDDGAKDYTTGADRIVSFSQRLNSDNMIFAPGAEINSTSSDGRFDVGDGNTSRINILSPLTKG